MGGRDSWWLRTTMYERLHPVVSNFQSPSKCLFLGGRSRLAKEMPDGIEKLNTDVRGRRGLPAINAEETPYDDNQWDYIVSDQMLEHVRKPWKAVVEMHRIVKPGGIVVCTTCSYNPVHPSPLDCYRFMPDGMKVLFEDFSSVHVDTWGSRDAMMYLMKGGKAKDYPNEPDERMKNAMESDDKKFPWMIWAVATK